MDYGLFTSTAEGGLAFPQPSATAIEHGHALLHFLGLVFGKALYEARALSQFLSRPPWRMHAAGDSIRVHAGDSAL